MLRLVATIRKELIILLRDRGGLAIMFLMPLVMITIMALIQDAPFRDYQELKIPLLLVNKDTGILGKTIENGLKQSKIFEINEQSRSVSETKKAIAESKFEIGIVIPENATDSFKVGISDFIAKKMSEGDSLQNIPQLKKGNEPQILLFFAPSTKKSFKVSVLSSLKQFTSRLSTFTMMDMFIRELGVTANSIDKREDVMSDFISFREEDTSDGTRENFSMNSVQHNVPAWTIFGMFFIILSMAGSLIKERDDGSYLRLRTMPGSYATVVIGKIAAYLAICLLQCILMLLVGIFIMPYLGLPQLVIGNNILAIIMIAVSCGLAATGSGILVGTVFNTHQQATTFGAVSIVILAALGGIWVPVYIMPDSIRFLADFSPLYWALKAFHEIFISAGTVRSVFPYALKLLIFFGFTVGLSYYAIRKKSY